MSKCKVLELYLFALSAALYHTTSFIWYVELLGTLQIAYCIKTKVAHF